MKFTRVLIFLLISLVLTGWMIYLLGLRYNFTPSFARGFYLIQDKTPPYEPGELVIFCPPDNTAFQLASEREYIARGLCGTGKFRPLIKRVVAVEGDKVVISEEDVHVNGARVTNSTIMTHDSKGRPITSFEGGIVPVGSLFLMSDENPNSYDGRYFGFITQEQIIGTIKPL